MASSKFKNILAATRAAWRNRFGLAGSDVANMDYAWDNGFRWKVRNAADTVDLPAIGSSSQDKVVVAGNPYTAANRVARYEEDLNASLSDTVFFIAPSACRVKAIQEVHNTIGSDAGAVTVTVRKCISGQTIAQGTALLSSAFSLKAATRVVQEGTLTTADDAALNLAAGDRLAVDFAGTLTAVTGVVVGVELEDAGIGEIVNLFMDANTRAVDQCFFVANRTYIVDRIDYVHETAGTDASAVSMQVTKDTSTNAPGAGTDILTTAFNCKGTINVVQNGALTATAATLRLDAGDRLSVDFAGTMTAYAGGFVQVRLVPKDELQEVSTTQKLNAASVDRTFFIADRDYEVIDIREVHSTAGTDGSAVSIQVTKDISNNAPGGGTDILTNGSGAGFDAKGTANTVQVGTLATTLSTRLLSRGDRLALDYAGTTTALEGVNVTVTLVRQ